MGHLRGQRYLDLVQGWAVNTLGHAPPALAQALTRLASRLLQARPGQAGPGLAGPGLAFTTTRRLNWPSG